MPASWPARQSSAATLGAYSWVPHGARISFSGSCALDPTSPRGRTLGSRALRPGAVILYAALCAAFAAVGAPYPSRAADDTARDARRFAAALEPPSAGPDAESHADHGRRSTGRLRGEVSFSRQEPVSGANVVLVRDGDPATLFLGTTDKDGNFRFEEVPEGTWTVGVVREGALPVLKAGILVKPPARAVVDLVLKKSPERLVPPIFDLARFERGQGGAGTAGESATVVSGRDQAVEGAAAGGTPIAAADGVEPRLVVRVLDAEMKPVREGRFLLRSRGPTVDPVRGIAGADGVLRVRAPQPGEYLVKVEMPGFLPARIDRLVIGRTPPVMTVVLTPRPLDFPATPSDLLPEERPVPPVGFPGASERTTTGGGGTSG